jgi:hypothetical protein
LAEKHLMKLAASFLDDYSDRLGNDGCNDWDWPTDWTREQCDEFLRNYHAFNGDPEEYTSGGRLPNFAAVAYLAHLLGVTNG